MLTARFLLPIMGSIMGFVLTRLPATQRQPWNTSPTSPPESRIEILPEEGSLSPSRRKAGLRAKIGTQPPLPHSEDYNSWQLTCPPQDPCSNVMCQVFP